MRYIDSDICTFVEYVKKNNKKIILFGAGAVCRTFIPYISRKYNLQDEYLYVIDNNSAKQGQKVEINALEIPIVTSDVLNKCKEDYCILITNGEFYSVMQQLNQIDACKEKDCFIATYMQLDRQYDKSVHTVFVDFQEPQIPKRINYCWFSGNPMPESLQKCIQTWKEYCPDYEIVRWDESNVDLKKYRYTKEAYEAKKWGFIPDLVRLQILYEVGGFYFDTDVEMLRNIDALRYQNAFCGRERAGHINFGGGSGSVPHNSIIGELFDFRKDVPFLLGEGKLNTEASGYFETTPLIKYGLELEDVNQKLDGINVYASEFFSPYNYISGEEIQNHNTFSIHHFNGSWLEKGNLLRMETREKYQTLKQNLERICL